MDKSGTSARGGGYAQDAAGGTNYLVAANYLEHRRLLSGSWSYVTGNADEDGWWDVSDTAVTSYVGCSGRTLDAKILRNWSAPGDSGSDWVFSSNVGC